MRTELAKMDLGNISAAERAAIENDIRVFEEAAPQEDGTADGETGDPRLAMEEARWRTELGAEAARERDPQSEREIALLAERRAAAERSDRREMLVRR